MMKYLITGGCGFLGSNLASEVLAKGEELYVFDNLYRESAYKNLEWLRSKGEFKFIHADIRNWNDVGNVIKSIKPDVIFHLAGQVAMTTSLENPRMDFEVNALGSLNILEAVRKYSPDSIVIYSSTNKVYGDLEHLNYQETETRYVAVDYPNGFDESLKLDFHSPYGCSKGAAEQYMLDYARMFGLKTVVFRHSSIFGGRQFSTYDQGWIGWFCQKALETKKGSIDEFTISGNGKQVRDVLHAEDVVDLYFKTAGRIEEAEGQAFNIGGGMENSVSLLELFEILEKELDVELRYKKRPWRVSDQKVFVADISKVRERIGWQPEIDKLGGIKKRRHKEDAGVGKGAE
jgi:CDP-paratose 2-epimerase